MSRNAADVLVALGAGPEVVLRELVDGIVRDGRVGEATARRWLDQG